MKTLISCSLIVVMVVCSITFPKQENDPAEVKLVEEAVLDYVEGVYESDTARIYKSVHPTLVKRGTSYDPQKKEFRPIQEMSFQQLVSLTKNWNRDGSRANSETIREVTVYEVLDQTASAKVVAAWGTDYFHLAKIDGKWYIMNVLWQSQKPD